MALKHIGIAVAALLAGSWLVESRAQAPGQDVPIRAGNLHVLSAADHDIFIRAFALAAKSDWAGAMTLGNEGQDTTARQLLQWKYALDRDSGAKFADVDAALKMASGCRISIRAGTRPATHVSRPPSRRAPRTTSWWPTPARPRFAR